VARLAGFPLPDEVPFEPDLVGFVDGEVEGFPFGGPADGKDGGGAKEASNPAGLLVGGRVDDGVAPGGGVASSRNGDGEGGLAPAGDEVAGELPGGVVGEEDVAVVGIPDADDGGSDLGVAAEHDGGAELGRAGEGVVPEGHAEGSDGLLDYWIGG
jgi:hypothetical protein